MRKSPEIPGHRTCDSSPSRSLYSSHILVRYSTEIETNKNDLDFLGCFSQETMEKANKAYHLGLDLSEFAKAAAVLSRQSARSSLMLASFCIPSYLLYNIVYMPSKSDGSKECKCMHIFYHGLLQSRAIHPRNTVSS